MKPMGVVLGICKRVLVRAVCPAASGTLGGDSLSLWSPSGVSALQAGPASACWSGTASPPWPSPAC